MRAKCFYLGMIAVLVLHFNSFPQKIDISGRVLSNDNVPQIGVIATLKSLHLSDTTGSDGTYHFLRDTGSAVYMQQGSKNFLPVKFEGANLFFSVQEPQQTVAIDIYDLLGKKIGNVLNEKLSEGNYSINTLGYCGANISSQLYIIRLQIDKKVFFHKTITFNNKQNRKMAGSSSLRSTDVLEKRAQDIDTIAFSKDSQVITTEGIANLVEVLPDLFIIQRDIYGNIIMCQDTISTIQAVISGTGIPDSTPMIANLWYNSLTSGYSGFVYFVYTAGVRNYSLYVNVFNTNSIFIARSATISFPSTAGDINLPNFSACNGKPIVNAGNDTVMAVTDSMKLHPVAIDSFGSIIKWEWSINGNSFVKTSKGDTVIIAPSSPNANYKCIVRVTDNHGNIAIDSMSVLVVQEMITDIDGNVYYYVTIGTQVWMVGNLKTTRLNDGTAIPLVTDGTAWAALTTPAYCWYADSVTLGNTYGALYNWYTVNTGKLAPKGWHVATDSEWSVLTTYLGGESVAGGKLKEAGTTHWNSPNTVATNETGFTALPGGYRDTNGTFIYIGINGGWWSVTAYDATYSWIRSMYCNYAFVDRGSCYNKLGFSVRCVRDQN